MFWRVFELFRVVPPVAVDGALCVVAWWMLVLDEGDKRNVSDAECVT